MFAAINTTVQQILIPVYQFWIAKLGNHAYSMHVCSGKKTLTKFSGVSSNGKVTIQNRCDTLEIKDWA